MESVSSKLHLLEGQVGSQAEEINQLKVKVDLFETQFNQVNVQIEFLLKASSSSPSQQCSQEHLDRKCPLKVIETINEEIDQSTVHLEESEVTLDLFYNFAINCFI